MKKIDDIKHYISVRRSEFYPDMNVEGLKPSLAIFEERYVQGFFVFCN
jgi:hypothetical protein